MDLPQIPDQATEKSDLLSRQGAVVETYRLLGGTRFGPYFQLRYRDEGHQRDIYLGKSVPQANAVREWLNQLQSRTYRRRQEQKLKRFALSQLRQRRAVWKAALREIGLNARGYQVQGLRRFHSALAKEITDGFQANRP